MCMCVCVCFYLSIPIYLYVCMWLRPGGRLLPPPFTPNDIPPLGRPRSPPPALSLRVEWWGGLVSAFFQWLCL